jgi:hypothetical protein
MKPNMTREEAETIVRYDIEQLLPDWLQGGEWKFVLSCMSPQMIRINNNKVETSGGYCIDLEDAKSLLSSIKKNIDVKGRKIKVSVSGENAHHGFEFKGFDRSKGILKVGCAEIWFDQACEVLREKK